MGVMSVERCYLESTKGRYEVMSVERCYLESIKGRYESDEGAGMLRREYKK